MASSLTLERAVRTVVSVFTAFFLEMRAELLPLVLPAAPSGGFLFWSRAVVILVACSGLGLAGAFLAGFGAARGTAGSAGATAFCKTTGPIRNLASNRMVEK